MNVVRELTKTAGSTTYPMEAALELSTCRARASVRTHGCELSLFGPPIFMTMYWYFVPGGAGI